MNLPVTQAPRQTLALMDVGTFEHMQRVGKMLALSPLFPEHLRKGSIDVAIANGVLVMNMAVRLGEDPLTVAQNIYFVGGKPGWSSSYMISKANSHGVFAGPIEWEVKGQGDSLSVTAFAKMARSGNRVAVTCDMKLAKAEGWTKNTKYQTMPEQMLRYRSASWLIRLYCPEVMVGVPAAVEVELGMRDVTPDYDMSHVADTQGEVVEAVEVTKPAQVAATEAAQVETAKVETAPAQDNPAKTEAPKAEPTAQEQDESPARDVLVGMKDTIINDTLDTRSPKDVAEVYPELLAKLAKHAPDLHAEVMETFAQVEAQAPEGGSNE